MKKYFCLLCSTLFVNGMLHAQSLREGYVVNPSSQELHTYVNAWNGGAGSLTVDSKAWGDEEFFTSRVKPRTRIVRYGAGDVNNFIADDDKRILWWVPIGDPSFWAIPNALYDSEVFSCWSYIDHFGSFSNPYGWVDGAFADAAHKNGVAVSGNASVPQGSVSAAWTTCFNGLGDIYNRDQTALPKFLLYHGVDGLAYNSEWTTTSTVMDNLHHTHESIVDYFAKQGIPTAENIWYDGTHDNGSAGFDNFLDNQSKMFKSASIFSNYNWNTKLLDSVPKRAMRVFPEDVRAPFHYYAGCNMQGGEPKSFKGAYERLDGTNVSIGYWGAHTRNMFWEGRGAGGTSALARQQYYLNQCETFFTNGVRNPAVHLATIDNEAHRPSENWQGISAYRNAASTITHTISQEAFYTFFNLGNGTFFNWKGQRLSDNEWYSLGVQDYMPTWRFWFAPTFMASTVAKGAQGLEANFTWEDAYVGGSCLKISGSADTEYLHLFKSAIIPNANNKVVVRYRLLNGEADINLVLSTCNDPSTVKYTLKDVLTVAESSEKADQSFDINREERWVTKVFNVSSAQATQYNKGGGIGVIALEIKNAKNLELLLGEFGIYPSGSQAASETVISNSITPSAPSITNAVVLANNQYGVDGKMVWTMDGGAGRAAGTPVYNADVNTSMFKMYAQEEGGPETFMGVTTSWAGLLYKCPVTLGGNKRVRFGVSAVSADTRSESAITWSAYMAKPDYAMCEDITIDKPVLKANESFSFGYIDPMHEPSTWTLVDESGNTVLTQTGHTIQVSDGLPNVGGYTLYINKGQVDQRMFAYYVQVSGPEVGAVPEIYTVARDGEALTGTESGASITLLDHPVLSYTGRSADGNASRAVSLASNYFGAKIGDLGINARESFSVAGWVKFNEIPSLYWHFLNISDRTSAWPNNEWGWGWTSGSPVGHYDASFRGDSRPTPDGVQYSFPDALFQAGIWTHIAWICEYTTNPQVGFRHQLYINGVKQTGTVTATLADSQGNKTIRTTNGVTYDAVDSDTFVWGHSFAVSSDEYIYFGGPKFNGAAVDGVVDDFQVWNKAMTQSDVENSMAGFPGGYPSSLLAIWDFEDDYSADFKFKSKGAKTGVGCGTFSTQTDPNDNSSTPRSIVIYSRSGYAGGCPFLTGTAMPVKTKAIWSDNFRLTNFATAQADGDEGASGSATVSFNDPGDHNVKLSLENLYGKDQFDFPVYTVQQNAAVTGVTADGEGFDAYTEGRVLFLEFAADGIYDVQVYNVSGMLIASDELSAVAGQSAQVSLATSGVYLVKVVKDGQVLRTVKVLSK